jgi:hypothetical protein
VGAKGGWLKTQLRHHRCIPPFAMPVSRLLKRFWSTGERWCVLWYEDDVFELRLYERGRLIALEPYARPERAFELSIVWRDHPPPWPPY